MSTPNPQGSSPNRILGIVALVAIVVFSVLAVVVPILTGVTSTPFAIFTIIVGIIGAFSSFLGAFPQIRNALVYSIKSISIPLPKRQSLLPIGVVSIIILLAINVIQGTIILSRIGPGQPNPATSSPLPTKSPAQGVSETPTTVVSSPTTEATTSPACSGDACSSLIPNASPVLDDHLSDSNSPKQWQIGQQGSATCSFSQGTYQIVAPAGSTGGECNTQAENTSFTNFVYQIKMMILQGVGKDAGAGIAFCSSNALNGSFYGVSFNETGYWSFGVLTNGNSPNSNVRTIISGTSQYFHTAVGQANYLTVKVKDHKFEAQINGYPLFSNITDTTLNGGFIGVEIGPGSLNSDVAFSDAKVWQV